MDFIIGDVELSVVAGFEALMGVDEAMGVVGMSNVCCSSSSNDSAHCSSVWVLSLINVIPNSLFPMSPVLSAMSSTLSVCDASKVSVLVGLLV